MQYSGECVQALILSMSLSYAVVVLHRESYSDKAA